MTAIDIQFTNDFNEACILRDQGFEPIECAFGQFGSVMGPSAWIITARKAIAKGLRFVPVEMRTELARTIRASS